MRADVYLTTHGFYESRSQAQAAIKSGKVSVNGKTIRKAGEAVPEGAEVSAKSLHPYVSRGGLKLAHALKVFGVDVTGRTALDIGASTGGFTDVLLQKGVRHVYAVDVGHGQLHRRLQDHAQVSSLENTDARTLAPAQFPDRPTIVVCDASFISITKVLGAALAIPAAGAHLIALVKPQFEVGQAGVGRGGIVKSEADALMALSDVSAWVSGQGWHVCATTDSPIKGGSNNGAGNHEYLLHAIKQ